KTGHSIVCVKALNVRRLFVDAKDNPISAYPGLVLAFLVKTPKIVERGPQYELDGQRHFKVGMCKAVHPGNIAPEIIDLCHLLTACKSVDQSSTRHDSAQKDAEKNC